MYVATEISKITAGELQKKIDIWVLKIIEDEAETWGSKQDSAYYTQAPKSLT